MGSICFASFGIVLLISHVVAAQWAAPITSQAFREINKEGVRSFEARSGLLGALQALTATSYESRLVLQAHDKHESPVTDYSQVLFRTEIQVGTPPQPFRAVIDLSWSDVFLLSSQCSGEACESHQLYNSSASSTHIANNTAVAIHYAGLYTDGVAGQDIFHVAGIHIANQSFEEATRLRPSPLYWHEQMDTVLGLSRVLMENTESNLRTNGPLQNIISQNLLDRNLFALKLPRPHDPEGEIMFGAVNHDMFEGNLLTLPITQTHHDRDLPSYLLGNGWLLEAHSISLIGNCSNVTASLAGYTVALTTTHPYISLPRPLVSALLSAVGADEDDWNAVDCSRRHTMPDLTILLGHDGHALVLSPWDYVTEVAKMGGGTMCIVWFQGHREVAEEPKYVILGTNFLSSVYSVFDAQGLTVSFAPLAKRSSSDDMRG